MFRPILFYSLAALATLAALAPIRPALAQGGPVVNAAAIPEVFNVNDGKVTIHATNLPSSILLAILNQMKVSYVFGAVSSPISERLTFMSMNVQDMPSSAP